MRDTPPMTEMHPGTLHLVGTGPGDPELLTLKAARLLGEVPVVAFPRSDRGGTMAHDIVQAHIGPAALLEPVEVPMLADRGAETQRALGIAYDAGAERIAGHLAAGRDVAYLCEGDPLFYGTAIYIAERLAGRYPIRVVPGITAFTAAAAAIPLPLVTGTAPLTVLAGTDPEAELAPQLEAPGAIVVMKVGRHFDRLRQLCIGAGRAEATWLCERVGHAGERIVPLAAAEPGPKPYFSLLLCAAVAGALR